LARTGIQKNPLVGVTLKLFEAAAAVRLIVTMVLMTALAHHASALNPGWRISQYGHTVWRVRDGALPGPPNAIAQTKDGYLWIGTPSGLTRFDGVRFLPWVPPPGETLPSPEILSLLGASDGSLWIGTASGLSRWRNGHLTAYPNTGSINAVVEDRQGGIWLAESRTGGRRSGPFCQVKGKTLRCYDKPDGIPFGIQGAEALVTDGLDGFWIGSVKGVCHWTPHSSASYFPKELEKAEGSSGVAALRLEPDGSLLIGLGGAGIRRLISGVWTKDSTGELTGSEGNVAGVLRDGDGGVWIATAAAGLVHRHRGTSESFGYKDGLSGDTVLSLYEDREGNIWAGSTEGLDRFRDIAIGTISRREGLSQDHAFTVLASSTGTIWIGTLLFLDTLREGSPFTIASRYLSGKSSTSLLEDHLGRIWVGAGDELNVIEGDRLRAIRRPDGAPLGVVIALTEDRIHDVYALVTGSPQKLFQIRNTRVIQIVDVPGLVASSPMAADPRDGVWIGFRDGALRRFRSGTFEDFPGITPASFRTLSIDPDGSVWGASAKGLFRLHSGTRRMLSKANGLPCDQVYSVIRDNADAVWLSAACGIVSIDDNEIKRWWAHPETPIRAHLFNALDGAQTAVLPFGPVVSKAPDGRLWFANGANVQFVDPSHLPYNRLPPPVHIEQAVADGKTYPPQRSLQLPPGTRNLQIDYTANSLTIPERVQFRYRLDGTDENWREPGTRRQAFYDKLLPGPYRFRVVACNNSGLWNETEATWDFSIAPAWYQTAWFRCLAIGSSFLTLWLIYRLRLRQIAAALNARFEERAAERNRLACELHDTVLQTIQAVKMIADNTRLDHSADPAHLREAIDRISEWLSQAAMEARAALNALRTSAIQTNDLKQAFERTAEAFHVSSRMSFVLSVNGSARDLHPIVRDEIYRVGSEAIRNACLHSNAARLEVHLSYRRDFTLRVRDNGTGMDAEVAKSGKPGHFGLTGMRERANRIQGTLRLTSRSGDGTEIELTVPGNVAFRADGNGV
jgi:signal transduction histidine kinase/ligand-binding sensor domain-containing protein